VADTSYNNIFAMSRYQLIRTDSDGYKKISPNCVHPFTAVWKMLSVTEKTTLILQTSAIMLFSLYLTQAVLATWTNDFKMPLHLCGTTTVSIFSSCSRAIPNGLKLHRLCFLNKLHLIVLTSSSASFTYIRHPYSMNSRRQTSSVPSSDTFTQLNSRNVDYPTCISYCQSLHAFD
jgi:hypothetical protein